MSTRLNEAQAAALDNYCRRAGKNRSEAIGDLVALGYLESLAPAKPGEPVLSPNAHGGCDIHVSFTRAQGDLFLRVLRAIQEYPESN